METVFDYNITDEEREYLGITGEGMIDAATHSEFTSNLCLASLFWYRGDKNKAVKYADRLPEEDRIDFYRTVTHP